MSASLEFPSGLDSLFAPQWTGRATMSSEEPQGGLAAIEAAYEALGRLLDVLEPGKIRPAAAQLPSAAGVRIAPGPVRSLRCRSYLKFAAPSGLRQSSNPVRMR